MNRHRQKLFTLVRTVGTAFASLIMGMDRKIEKKYWTTNRILMAIAVFAIISLSVYAFGFMDTRSSLNIDPDRITITQVKQDFFQDVLSVTGTVQPIETTFLDAIEGGVVQQVFRESGENVQKGDTILTLANSTLQLQVMQQSSGLYDQINNVRNSRLNLDQNTLTLLEQLADAKKEMEILKSRYEAEKRLVENGMIPLQDFEVTKKNYQFEQHRYQLIRQSYLKDSLQAINRHKQMDESEKRMYRNLEAVQQILDNLIVTAPITGQLSTVELHQGQSIEPGERIGQVDVLDHYKVRVRVDEYHLPKITVGLAGTYTHGEKTYKLRVTKVSPVVNDGFFVIDMIFEGETPAGLKRGQSLRIQLKLSDTEFVTLLNRGSFYQHTGGSWIYVLNEKEGRAYKRNIRLGRNNADHFEVESGLQPGEKVIISSYDAFGEKDVLILK